MYGSSSVLQASPGSSSDPFKEAEADEAVGGSSDPFSVEEGQIVRVHIRDDLVAAVVLKCDEEKQTCDLALGNEYSSIEYGVPFAAVQQDAGDTSIPSLGGLDGVSGQLMEQVRAIRDDLLPAAPKSHGKKKDEAKLLDVRMLKADIRRIVDILRVRCVYSYLFGCEV
jgi:hypothetical protein